MEYFWGSRSQSPISNNLDVISYENLSFPRSFSYIDAVALVSYRLVSYNMKECSS